MGSFRSVWGLAKLVHFVGCKAELPVLRITPMNKQDRAGLILDGRLEGPWVEILNNSWRQAVTAEGNRVVVDLGGVTFVDLKGSELLLTMQSEGAELTKSSAFLREMLKLTNAKRQSCD